MPLKKKKRKLTPHKNLHMDIFSSFIHNCQNLEPGPSLVAQWLRIHLQMQGHGFEPWSGKIPHAAEQLSLCITTTELAL